MEGKLCRCCLDVLTKCFENDFQIGDEGAVSFGAGSLVLWYFENKILMPSDNDLGSTVSLSLNAINRTTSNDVLFLLSVQGRCS